MKSPLGSQLQLGDPINAGLVGYWLLNENGGARVNDLSSNGNHGAITGGSWVGGKYGPSLVFSGSTDVTLTASIPVTSGITYVVWCRRSTDHTGVLIANRWTQLRVVTANVSWYADLDAAGVTTTTNPIAIGPWYCIAVTQVGTAYAIYVDGVSVLSGATVAMDNTDLRKYLGCNVPGNTTFYGAMSSAAIYNRALTAAEIAQLYREPFCGLCRRRVELWTGATSPTIVTPSTGSIMTLNTGFWGGV